MRPDAAPALGEILARRYRCTDCGTVLTVVPRGMAAALRYTLATIAMALMLWGLRGRTPAQARRATSPLRCLGVCEPHRWRSLRRWTRKAERLFDLPSSLEAPTVRDLARRVAHLLIARGPPDRPALHRAFEGAGLR
ncbi:MAG: hypothetical protein AB1Z63_07590 [Candidatus Limnocylindrales bacterium]